MITIAGDIIISPHGHTGLSAPRQSRKRILSPIFSPPPRAEPKSAALNTDNTTPYANIGGGHAAELLSQRSYREQHHDTASGAVRCC